MVKKIRRVRTFARTASKSMEKKLISNAKKVKDDPYVIIPSYDDSYSEKSFKKIRKKIDKVKKSIGDSKKLEKISNKTGIEGAIAGTILLANSEKAPYLAVGKFPTGDVSYAQRGRADKEKLIAVQHFDDPVLRILGIKDLASKKNLHIYSWDCGFYSSGNTAKPPEEFIEFLESKLDLNKKDNVFYTKDLKSDIVKNNEFKEKIYLRIFWKSADIIIGISERSASKEKNTIYNLTKYLFENNIKEDFDISVNGSPYKGSNVENQKTIDISDYLSGKLKDYDFIKNNIKDRKEKLIDSSDKVFILNGESYGLDMDKFISDLDPDEYEKKGLEFILSKVDEPIIFDDATPNRVLEAYWDDYGLELIKDIIDDEDMAKKFFDLKEEPSDILELVSNYKKRQEILSKLPRYEKLPSIAEYADNIAKTYKSFGEKKTLIELRDKPSDTKAKSLSYAFLLALGKGSDKKWKYTDVEIEYGNFLKDYAKKLLNSNPKDYHKNLKELLTASGLTDNIDSKLL